MGRLKKYWTEEQKAEARKKRQMKYYWKHKKEINFKDRIRYEGGRENNTDTIKDGI